MLKRNYHADIEAFWQEVVKDNPDPQKVSELLDRSSAFRGVSESGWVSR